jgi:uncharacterized membrane protein YcaP (DUF421 family)
LLGVSPSEAWAVVVATVAVFTATVAVLRLAGARAAARLRTTDVAVLVLIGAILGRAVIGVQPTLGAGLIALAVLVVLRVATALLERTALRGVLAARPLMLVAGGQEVPEHLRRARVSREDLRLVLRLAGVATVAEVAAAVLEPTGAISVARRDPGRPLDRRLFADVRGLERIPEDWFGAPVEG